MEVNPGLQELDFTTVQKLKEIMIGEEFIT